MSKLVIKLKEYIDNNKDIGIVYIITNDDKLGNIYKDYIEYKLEELKVDRFIYIQVISELYMYSQMYSMSNHSKDCLILLCDEWNKNKWVSKYNLLEYFNKCNTMSINGIDKVVKL